METSRYEAEGHLVGCAYCGEAAPDSFARPKQGKKGQWDRRRRAYDPERGRLWEICRSCDRWSPVPLDLRWEVLERLERSVHDGGLRVLESAHLALFRTDRGEVVRVGLPTHTEWGSWRYGLTLGLSAQRPGLLARTLASLPPPPLEGYDPYGLAGPLGGVGGKHGPVEWLASPFLNQARQLTLTFASVPFAAACPSCAGPMPLRPWDFSRVCLHIVSGGVGVEGRCGSCGTMVPLKLGAVRAALRLGLAVLDSDRDARAVGEEAGAGLDSAGGVDVFLNRLAEHGPQLGELRRVERVALGIALDLSAEAEALQSEWAEAEEIASIMDGELTHVRGFREFRARILGEIA